MWTYNTTYLSHHGIKGQKWGFRRFQNDDGSLTEEGKKRYRTDDVKKARRRDMAAKAGLALGAVSVFQTARNLKTANRVNRELGFPNVPLSEVLNKGSIAAGKAVVKGALAGYTLRYLLDQTDRKTNTKTYKANAWDEKPSDERSWDEKPSKKKGSYNF